MKGAPPLPDQQKANGHGPDNSCPLGVHGRKNNFGVSSLKACMWVAATPNVPLQRPSHLPDPLPRSLESEGESRSVTSDSLRPHGLHRPWNSPGQNTGVGSLSLLQGIFATQGWNPGLPHCRLILYQLSHQGSP